MIQFFQEVYGVDILDEMGLTVLDMGYSMVESGVTGIMIAVSVVVIVAQFIKWNVLEGKRGKEFQNFLPVKSSACVTYDYICGILFLWVPAVITGIVVLILAKQYEMEELMDVNKGFNIISDVWSEVGREIIVLSCIYCFLVFAKKITRYIPGILLLLLLCCYMVWLVTAGSSVFWNWGFYNAGNTLEYMLILALVPVFVLLSYFCDRKRDIAGGGLFYFKSVHFLVMLIVFAESFVICVSGMVIPGKVAAYIISLILAAVVTVGMHYLTWGRRAR